MQLYPSSLHKHGQRRITARSDAPQLTWYGTQL